MTLFEKKIAVGVSGGIAAYKACELVRELKRNGALVRVCMTESATRFVGPLTLATLSENSVSMSLFADAEVDGTVHLDLARWCDALVVCPATANILAKSRNGLADDFLSTALLATEAPIVFCPAMNSAMWAKPVVQDHVRVLRERGAKLVDPEWGELATTSEGKGIGRLAETGRIMQAIKQAVLGNKQLAGKKVLVSAGPTREALDPVRFITNYSTGKMGFALAEAAKLRGASVTLVCGPNQINSIEGVNQIDVESVEQMLSALKSEYSDSDLLLMAAAVSDYLPKRKSPQKLKKASTSLAIELRKAPDILTALSDPNATCVRVGFALETENEIANAQVKLAEKDLDMVVLNNPLQSGAAFGGDTNIVTLIERKGAIETLPKMSKAEVADKILDKISPLLYADSSKTVAV